MIVDVHQFGIGTKVLLRSCPFGQPGTVLEVKRGKLTVHWPDLDVCGRHRPESLKEAASLAGNL